jgi:glycosyltransferase involved in cell wall biosynthesis
MRIWIIHQHAIPPTQMGPTRHFDLAAELIKRGHEVYIFASNFCHNSFHYIGQPFRSTQVPDYFNKVPFIWVASPNYRGNSFARFWNMLIFAKNVLDPYHLQHMPKPDVIIGSSPSPFAALAAQRLAKHFRVSFLYEIRDLWPETLVNLGRFTKYHPLILSLSQIEKYLLKNANHIVTVLPGASEYLVSRGVDAAQVLWLPNFVHFKKIIYRAPIASHPLKIIYSGSFNIANDVETLLQAAVILQQQGWSDRIKIQLLGDGPQKNYLQQWSRTHHLSLVEFLEPVAKESVYDVLQTADVFVSLIKNVNLYRWGTSLNKISDYMACGRPVIFAINSPYNPISEARAGLTVPPQDPVALAAAIKKITLLSPEEREQMGQNGRSYAQKFYDVSAAVERLEGVLFILTSQAR